MTTRLLTLGAGLFAAGLVGSAMAAVPDPSPRSHMTHGRAGTDIVLATQPRVSAPCPDRGKVSRRVTASEARRRPAHPAV